MAAATRKSRADADLAPVENVRVSAQDAPEMHVWRVDGTVVRALLCSPSKSPVTESVEQAAPAKSGSMDPGRADW